MLSSHRKFIGKTCYFPCFVDEENGSYETRNSFFVPWPCIVHPWLRSRLLILGFPFPFFFHSCPFPLSYGSVRIFRYMVTFVSDCEGLSLLFLILLSFPPFLALLQWLGVSGQYRVGVVRINILVLFLLVRGKIQSFIIKYDTSCRIFANLLYDSEELPFIPSLLRFGKSWIGVMVFLYLLI